MTIDVVQQPRKGPTAYNPPKLPTLKHKMFSPKIDRKNIRFHNKKINIDTSGFMLSPRKVHFEGNAWEGNLTDRTQGAKDLNAVVREQATVISDLKNQILELRHELELKDEKIREQNDTIAANKRNIKVERFRDDLEIAHIVPRLRLCLQVFENNLQEYLFESKTTMTKDEFLATLLDKLNIEKNEDALLLADYFIPDRAQEIKTWKVLEKIIQIAGPYRSFKDSDFIKLKETFENVDIEK